MTMPFLGSTGPFSVTSTDKISIIDDQMLALCIHFYIILSLTHDNY